MKKISAHAWVTIFVPLVMLGGCGGGPSTPPNVILITMDTMRADHLGCYGYDRPTSPIIDAFAGEATLYTRALSSAPWTVPTHASLFTGRFPFEHGSRTFDAKTKNIVSKLDDQHVTLAEVLAAEGYATAAFVANSGWLSARLNMNQGFQTYQVKRDYSPGVNKNVMWWLKKNNNEQPFFIFINYIDSHRPYNVTNPAPFLETPAEDDNGKVVRLLYDAVLPGEEDAPPDLVQQMIDQYDTGVWNLDVEIGKLFDRLKKLGLYDNTMIVLTSDHGEFFGEHRLVEHSKDVYEPVMRIPLIIKNPGQKKGRVEDKLTGSTDIANLVLTRCGDVLSRYDDVFFDKPGNHEVIVENYYSRSHDRFNKRWGHRFNRVRTAIYDWPYKYIRSSDEKHELYRLDSDADEANNLIETEPGVAERLAARLEEFQRSRESYDGHVTPPELGEEELKQLKALGYIGD